MAFDSCHKICKDFDNNALVARRLSLSRAAHTKIGTRQFFNSQFLPLSSLQLPLVNLRSPFPPQLTVSTAAHLFHHNSPFPPQLTISPAAHHFHHSSPFPPQLTISITAHHFHHSSPLPPQLTLSTTEWPYG